ncbi:hypothetical protein Goarm_022977, partial [Gossypium armourianum]|nr:hypothetical protein [Gossypium armourianum]
TIHTTLATLWHPHGRISISNLGEKGYLFEFYYAIDINRVIDGNPWTFNKHILVLYKQKSGEDPLRVPLYSVDYWVQINDLTMGLTSKSSYPVQIVYGKKEILFEWGLSIKVIPRQSADDDRASAILGIKLDCRTNEVRDINEVKHPHDLTMVEDFPMVLGEGKKRPYTSRARKPTAMKILSWNIWGLRSPRAMCCLRWKFMDFYSLIEEARHCQSWDLLCRLSSRDPTPWLVMGDFNEIAFSHEKQGGRLHGERGMEAFWLTLNDYDLSNLGFEGRWCT